MPHPTLIFTEADLVALVGGGLIGDEVGPMQDRPLVAVVLHDAAQTQRLAPLVRHLPCVTVGVTDRSFAGPEGFDLYLCGDADASEPWVPCARSTEESLAGLAAAVSDHPVAALVLVQLLRVAPALDVAGGLMAESLAYATLQSGADHQRWLAERGDRSDGHARRDRRYGQDEAEPVLASRSAGTLRVSRVGHAIWPVDRRTGRARRPVHHLEFYVTKASASNKIGSNWKARAFPYCTA